MARWRGNMSWRKWCQQSLAAAVVLGGTSIPAMAVVIGNWEGVDDGWVDWSAGALAAPKYTYSSTVGVTNGSQSLVLEQSGWNQNLAIKLQNVGKKADFLANNLFSIDVTVPATTTGGWSKIEGLAINAQTYGFNNQPGSYLFGWGSTGGGAQTQTLSWDYSALVDGNAGNGEIAPTAGWIELLITTNSDGVHNTFHFDNARFTLIPEPTSLASLGLMTVLALRRRI